MKDESVKSLGHISVTLFYVISNLVVSLAVHSSAHAEYKRTRVLAVLTLETYFQVVAVFLLSRLPILNSLFPSSIRITRPLSRRFGLPSLLFFCLLFAKQFMLSVMGVSKTEIASSLVAPAAALLSYLTMGQLPTTSGIIVCILGTVSSLVALYGESLNMLFATLLSCSFNSGRTVAMKYANKSGQKVSAGQQMIIISYICAILCTVFMIGTDVLKEDTTGRGSIWLDIVVVDGAYAFNWRLLNLCVLSFISNLLTTLLMERLSPVAYHIQSQAKSVVLAFYDISEMWLYFPAWFAKICPAGDSSKITDADKWSIRLKSCSSFIYVTDKLIGYFYNKPKLALTGKGAGNDTNAHTYSQVKSAKSSVVCNSPLNSVDLMESGTTKSVCDITNNYSSSNSSIEVDGKKIELGVVDRYYTGAVCAPEDHVIDKVTSVDNNRAQQVIIQG